MVDLFDFPLGPPDGSGYSVRWVFGRYSGRYNGIHAGEDWGLLSGNSLGRPVYTIGHGTVTYAQPYGWGVDQGVVIVRHVFPDGSTILSFYGHLDPPSVVLRPGDCVTRGQQVGAIGKPRGRPHLHFEVRDRMPDQPGPGYWSVDPRLAGWQIPTDYIWTYRIHTAPGVQWTRPFTATGSTGIGLLSDGTLAALDEQRLIGIDPLDGRLRWSRPVSGTIVQSVIDASGSALYASSAGGSLQAFDAVGGPLWELDFASALWPALMPLPGGGVVVHTDRRLTGLSASGEQLWQIDRVAPPDAWVLNGDELIFTTDAEIPILHTLDRAGHLVWAARIGGQPAIAGDQVFVYNSTGLYRLDRAAFAADLIVPLDPGFYAVGHIRVTPDGGLIIAHRGQSDQRLIWINADGTLRWDRSIPGLALGTPQLFTYADSVYGLTVDGDVMLLDPLTGDAQRLFDGGLGTRLEGEAWAFVTQAGEVLFDLRGGEIIALDLPGAFQAAGGTP